MIATITSWPNAAVNIAGIVAIAVVIVSFCIILNDNKFPWEK